METKVVVKYNLNILEYFQFLSLWRKRGLQKYIWIKNLLIWQFYVDVFVSRKWQNYFSGLQKVTSNYVSDWKDYKDTVRKQYIKAKGLNRFLK